MGRLIAEERDERLADYLRNNDQFILTALGTYAEHMEKEAAKAQELYEAGQGDPEVKAAQDATLMTNNGLRHAAGMFRESAEKARREIGKLCDLMEADAEAAC